MDFKSMFLKGGKIIFQNLSGVTQNINLEEYIFFCGEIFLTNIGVGSSV